MFQQYFYIPDVFISMDQYFAGFFLHFIAVAQPKGHRLFRKLICRKQRWDFINSRFVRNGSDFLFFLYMIRVVCFARVFSLHTSSHIQYSSIYLFTFIGVSIFLHFLCYYAPLYRLFYLRLFIHLTAPPAYTLPHLCLPHF